MAHHPNRLCFRHADVFHRAVSAGHRAGVDLSGVVDTVLPTLFSLWVVLIRRRNKRMKLEERAERGNRDKAA